MMKAMKAHHVVSPCCLRANNLLLQGGDPGTQAVGTAMSPASAPVTNFPLGATRARIAG